MRFAPAAAAYQVGLGAAGEGPLPLRQRHEAGMIAALTLADADEAKAHLATDLGPLPDGMGWPQLIPYRLKDFLYPKTTEDDDSPPFR